eukprot:TRINITY_DN1345_c2_g1_i1.p1 TRINITY_DN1345_c2_g1~~TRINITY_DN1345_c2_g1_i1.p1  ORF type:complete len:177 (+),score=53.17 TRINITY_DN1345_c2_g1_i1:156-686(+)
MEVSCAQCEWSYADRQCETISLCPNTAPCTACRNHAPCGEFATQVACEKANTDDCVLCAWSGVVCSLSSCAQSCSHYSTEAACKAAMSGECPYDCAWSDGACMGAGEKAAEDGLKGFVIAIIVVSVLLVVVVVAVIVCCCCMGASVLSKPKGETAVLLEQPQPQTGGYANHVQGAP